MPPPVLTATEATRDHIDVEPRITIYISIENVLYTVTQPFKTITPYPYTSYVLSRLRRPGVKLVLLTIDNKEAIDDLVIKYPHLLTDFDEVTSYASSKTNNGGHVHRWTVTGYTYNFISARTPPILTGDTLEYYRLLQNSSNLPIIPIPYLQSEPAVYFGSDNKYLCIVDSSPRLRLRLRLRTNVAPKNRIVWNGKTTRYLTYAQGIDTQSYTHPHVQDTRPKTRGYEKLPQLDLIQIIKQRAALLDPLLADII